MRTDEWHPLWAELTRLESAWRGQGAPISRHLRPGLNVSEIDAAFSDLELTASTEARIWWSWHNGVEPASPSPERCGDWVGSAFRLLSLEQAVAATQLNRRIASDVADGDEKVADELWSRNWFVLSQDIGSLTLALDLHAIDGAFSPVRWWEPEAMVTLATEPPLLASMTGLVRLWTRWLENGWWRWDAKAQAWHGDAPPGLDVRLQQLA